MPENIDKTEHRGLQLFALPYESGLRITVLTIKINVSVREKEKQVFQKDSAKFSGFEWYVCGELL